MSRQIHTISEAPSVMPFVYEDAARPDSEFEREDATFSKVELNTRLLSRPFDLRVRMSACPSHTSVLTLKTCYLNRHLRIKPSLRSSMASGDYFENIWKTETSSRFIHPSSRALPQKAVRASSRLTISNVGTEFYAELSIVAGLIMEVRLRTRLSCSIPTASKANVYHC